MDKKERVPFLVRQNRVIVSKTPVEDFDNWVLSIGYSVKDCAQAIRGWFTPDRVYIYQGLEYQPAPVLNDWLLAQLLVAHSQRFNTLGPRIYNGVSAKSGMGIHLVMPATQHIVM